MIDPEESGVLPFTKAFRKSRIPRSDEPKEAVKACNWAVMGYSARVLVCSKSSRARAKSILQ